LQKGYAPARLNSLFDDAHLLCFTESGNPCGISSYRILGMVETPVMVNNTSYVAVMSYSGALHIIKGRGRFVEEMGSLLVRSMSELIQRMARHRREDVELCKDCAL